MNDREMLDWFEEKGEESYTVDRAGKLRYILIWLGLGDRLMRTEGASLRDCIKKASEGMGEGI